MELTSKYQYTYFIHPYVIEKSKYNKYMLKLLKDKNCSIRLFDKIKDMHYYEYFTPEIIDDIFWSFHLDKKDLREFETIDINLKANLLASKECTVFNYTLEKDLQGKVGMNDGIFFNINEVKMVCFNSGICFLVFKTSLLDNNNNFNDMLNVNYKFRDINPKTNALKQFENIHIQSDIFKDVEELSSFIMKITGTTQNKNIFRVSKEKMNIFSYCCLDQHSWNDETQNESMDNMFEKYRMIFPANKQMSDMQNKDKTQTEIFENTYVRYGISNFGTVLLTSDVNTSNYTTVPIRFEGEYLYSYILELYKNIFLQKLNYDFNNINDFTKVENEFLGFTQKLWIQNITQEEFGAKLCKKWNKKLEVDEKFLKLKHKYEILLKKNNITQNSNKNGKIAVCLVVLIILSIINLLK